MVRLTIPTGKPGFGVAGPGCARGRRRDSGVLLVPAAWANDEEESGEQREEERQDPSLTVMAPKVHARSIPLRKASAGSDRLEVRIGTVRRRRIAGTVKSLRTPPI
jgi:hypothetical protein